MTRVLVAGANGFVGAHVLRELLARGLPAVGLVREAAPRWRLPGLQAAATVVADITDAGAVKHAVAQTNAKVIINAASYGVAPAETDAERMFAVNLAGAQNLLYAAAGLRRFIQLGSYWEYGDCAEPLSEDTALKPKTRYAATKAAASLLAAGTTAVETVVLRLFDVWGPGESPHRLVSSIIRQCKAGQPLDLTLGTQAKDFAYAPDAARWIVDLALKREALTCSVVNLPGERRTVKDLATTAARAVRGEHLLRFGAKPLPEGEVQTGPVDTTRIDALLLRSFTPVAEGVQAMTLPALASA